MRGKVDYVERPNCGFIYGEDGKCIGSYLQYRLKSEIRLVFLRTLITKDSMLLEKWLRFKGDLC